jgi:hypothetical protein
VLTEECDILVGHHHRRENECVGRVLESGDDVAESGECRGDAFD